MHEANELAPVEARALPAGHEAHDGWPATFEYVPASHGLHVEMEL